MPTINVLDKSVAELIAAGEVIERPASVIKELVENAIDAGADHVTVEIKNGGITFMRVTDNGCGIAFEEIPTAFLRHATSKILTGSDLDNICTFGFRGEALASIAAVARVEMLTKQSHSEYGSSYKIEGGTETCHEKTGCPDGTTIIIRDLFYNTPARLKFLKKDVSEGNTVQAVIDKIALAHPEVAIKFIRDNKPVRITNGDGKHYSAIYSVFGKQFAASLIPVDYSVGNIKVCGYISSPLFSRANRSMQYFFVNTRSIKSVICMSALEEAFRNSIMVGKFPACVLNIDLPPSEVDVNVSPSKTEVRFAYEKNVFDAVYYGVKNGILNAENSREITIKPVEKQGVGKAENLVIAEQNVISEPERPVFSGERVRLSSEAAPYEMKQPEVIYKQERLSEIPLPQPPAMKNVQVEEEPEIANPFKFLSKTVFEKPKAAEEKPVIEPKTEAEEKEEKPPLMVIGELFKTYIICQCGEDMILMDKHAAHERIRFEKLKKDFYQHSQLLLEPVNVQLSAEEWNAFTDFGEELLEMGIDFVPHNDFVVEITSMPTMLAGGDERGTIEKIADILTHSNTNVKGEIFDEILHSMACKSAIRANEETSFEELKLLAETVWNDEKIRFCPHGRPIITVISKKELEKNFNRI